MKRKFWPVALILLSPVVFLILLALIYGMGVVAYEYITDPIVLIRGSRTIGTITEKHESSSDSTVTIIYNFAPRTGELFTDRYDFLLWSNLEVGDQIEIAFDPRDPARSLPAKPGFSLWYHILLVLIVFPIMIFLTGWFLVWAGRQFAGVWRIGRR